MALVIGIIYDRDENWIAGSYYIENLIFAFASLPQRKPVLKIYSSSRDHFESLKERTKYPSLTWVELKDRNTFFDRLINKFGYVLLKTHWIVRGIDNKVDILFPGSDSFFFDKIHTKLFWIPDFQELHYPLFFGKEELLKRKRYQQKLVKNRWPIIFSSFHAYSDFTRQYPAARSKSFVIPFAVTLPHTEGINIDLLKVKFRIEGRYFICSNQFWKHKNHQIVLKAVLELKKKGKQICVIFTGMPNDPRNPDYYKSILEFVKAHDLEENTKFLGFIDRREQIVLMKNSEAIIQPSLFEGWSTVVEDAKALQHPIVASDIPVHREQLGPDFKYYFHPDDFFKLSDIMEKVVHDTQVYDDYKISIERFANSMLHSMEIISSKKDSE